MLPMVATLAMGALAKQTAAARMNPAAASAGGGGLMGMLDRNRDGSVADDMAGMLGKFLR